MSAREISPPQVQAMTRPRLRRPPPERRLWQIHWSTAVVALILASAVLWLNLIPHDGNGDLLGVPGGGDAEGIGTPLIFNWWGYSPSCGATSYSRWALGIDIVFGLMAVAIPVVLMEFRHRAKRCRSPRGD
jgi:hypothetical protein